MSFSSDLWNSIGTIQKEFCLKFNDMHNITEVFKRLSKAEMTFAEQIKRICLFNKQIYNNSSLGNSIKQFFCFLENTSDIYKNHANTLNDWIIAPTEKFLNEQLTATNQIINEIIQKEQYISLKSIHLEQYKKKYHHLASKLVQATIKLEESIAKNSINQDEMKIELENQHKCSESLRLSKKEYINYLDKFNNNRESYNTKIKLGLITLQSRYIEIVEFYKWAFLTSEIYYKAFLKELKAENKKEEEVYQKLMPQNDMREFVEANRSTAFPMQRCDFVQYKFEYSVLNNLAFPSNVKENIKEYIKGEIKYVQPKKDDYTNDSLKMIEDFIQTSWNGDVDQITKSFIIGLLKESKFNRINLLQFINSYRPKGLFKISEGTYTLLVELLTVVLNFCLIDSDYETIKSVIIISQTFYKQCDNDNKEKIDLQAGLMDNPIFHNRDIWEGIIKYTINEEVIRKKTLNNNSANEDKENKKMKNLIVIILITNMFNMSTFGVSDNITKGITDYFCKLYQIDEDVFKNNDKNKINKSNEKISLGQIGVIKSIEDISNCNNKIELNKNDITKFISNSNKTDIMPSSDLTGLNEVNNKLNEIHSLNEDKTKTIV